MHFSRIFYAAGIAVFSLTVLAFAAPANAQSAGARAAYLAANGPRGIEFYALRSGGSVAESPAVVESHVLYGLASAPPGGQVVVDVPDGFEFESPFFVDMYSLVLSPDTRRIAFVRNTEANGFAMNDRPGELTVIDLATAATRVYPKPDSYRYPPRWSPDSAALLFNQHTWDPFLTRIDIVDAIQGDTRTAISGIMTQHHVEQAWMTPGRFLLLSWPNVYIGGRSVRGTYLFVTLTGPLVGASEDLADSIGFSNSAWSPRGERLLFNVVDRASESPFPATFGGLYSLDLDGRLTLLLDYRNVFSDTLVSDYPRIITSSRDGWLYLLSTDVSRGQTWRIDRVEGETLVPLAARATGVDGAPFYTISGYDVSPDGRFLAVSGYTEGPGTNTGLIFIVELGTGTVVLDEETPRPLCAPHWVSATAYIAAPNGRFGCVRGASDTLLWRDVVSGEQQTIALPDGRPFWLIAPQEG